MSEDNKNISAGNRIKRARLLAGIYSRKEFEQKFQISANTLQSWEQDKNRLTNKGALKLVKAFEREGLICSTDWLIHGTGVPPRSFEAASNINEPLTPYGKSSDLLIQEEESIYKEIQTFKENHPNSIIINIVDDALEPYFSVGDYIGGVKQFDESIPKFLNNFCIIELENHLIIPRYLNAGSAPKTYTLSCVNPNTSAQAPLTAYNSNIIFAAPIIWHRKKLNALKKKSS